jgi:F-type H+-transporting ATPase subunit delta
MTSGSVARRYAKAIFELATEDGNVDEVAGALAEIAVAVQDVGAEALAPGVLSRDSRTRLGEALAAKIGASTLLDKFIRLLCDRERIDVTPGINDWYVKMRDDAAGRVRLSITAAHELSDEEVSRISDAFQKLATREVVPDVGIDESLVGGALVELDGRVYDGSVKTYLARLAANMAGESS